MSNAQQVSAPVQPVPATATPSWIPGQKVWAGGLSFVVAWLLLQGASTVAAWANVRYGIPIVIPQDQGTLATVAAGVSYVVQYFVPPSVKDILGQVNTRLATLAKTDKQVATSLITAASKAPATQIVTTSDIAAVSPVNVTSNTINKVVSQ